MMVNVRGEKKEYKCTIHKLFVFSDFSLIFVQNVLRYYKPTNKSDKQQNDQPNETTNLSWVEVISNKYEKITLTNSNMITERSETDRLLLDR